MNDNVEGIILKQSDYKENSLILSVLTKEYGKISLIAQGAKKITSKNASHILPYTKSNFLFDYIETKTIFRLKNVSTISLYRHLHEDLFASTAASVVGELCDVMSYDDSDLSFLQDLYVLTETTFTYLNDLKNVQLVLALYVSSILKLFGIQPEVDGCAICGQEKVVTISVEDGGFLCQEHAYQHNKKNIDPSILHEFRVINKANIEHYDVLEPIIDNPTVHLDYLMNILMIHTGVKIKSYEFFKQLQVIEG